MYHSSSFRVSTAPPKNLQIILVNAILNNKHFLMEVSYWITILDFKRKIEKNFKIAIADQRLFYKAQELAQNNLSLHSLGFHKKIKIILREKPKLEGKFGIVERYETLPKMPVIDELLSTVQEGFAQKLIPKLTFEGTSGSYFLQNKFRKNIAIFKPFDEEPMAPNNPKGYPGKIGSPAFKPGILSGESAMREVAAYLLDQKSGKTFAGVPPTTFVEIVHPYFSNRDMKEKEIGDTTSIFLQNFSQFTSGSKKSIIKHGSLQYFVAGAEEASDFGPSKFPDEEVRKIAILDLRILNCDRNEGNILVKKDKKSFELIPIDHGLSFPDCFEASIYDIIWMEWPQVKKPWTPTELEYIRKLDPKSDVENLSHHFKFRDICLRNFRIAGTVLKKFANNGLTIHDIGTFMYRDDPEIESAIEGLIKETEDFVETMRSSVFNNIVNKIADNSPKKKSKPVSFPSPTKEKEEEQVYDPLAETYNSLRTRAYSFDDPNEVHPQNMLKSILEKSEKEIKEKEETTGGLYSIPEVGRSFGTDSRSQHKNNGLFKNNKTSVILKDLDSEDFSSSDLEDKDDYNELDQQLAAPTIKRSSSIPLLNSRIYQQGTPKSAKISNSNLSPTNKRKSKERVVLFKKKDVPPAHKDELFFKYFESFLHQRVEILLKSRNMIPKRNRFLSDY